MVEVGAIGDSGEPRIDANDITCAGRGKGSVDIVARCANVKPLNPTQTSVDAGSVTWKRRTVLPPSIDRFALPGPTMSTLLEISSVDCSWIVCGPAARLNSIVSVSVSAFARAIAARSEPGPASAVFSTI